MPQEFFSLPQQGNATNNNDVILSYPSSYPNANIIAVASITSTGGLSSFSNYGATTVDLGAPGSSIYSTLPTKVVNTQHTVHIAEHLWQHLTLPVVQLSTLLPIPGASASVIKNAILSSTIPTSSLSGKCVTGGRLNVSGF